MYGSSSSIVSSLMLSLRCCPNSISCFRKDVSAITDCAELKLGSNRCTSFLFTVSLAGVTGTSGRMNRMHTPSNTSLMMSDGFGSALSSLRSAGWMLSTAASASSRYGLALARSSSASAFSAWMRRASLSHMSLMRATFSFSFLASRLDTSSDPSISLVASSARFSLTSLSASTTFMSSTSLAPWASFCSPRCTRASCVLTWPSLSAYSSLNVSRKLRKLLGVCHTRRRSDRK
mmetsp:Transcript_9936/g.31304  ORF Transcript_9936/g.31304 Transcript_9936/m.31304 type:complete len:233 (-) Transcript_9936:16-714(-)